MAGSAWPRRAATTWTGTPARSSVVACRWRRSCSRSWGSGRTVVSVDQLGHERADSVGVERFAPPVGEDQAAAVVPGRPGGKPFFGLLATVLAQYGNGFAVNADCAGTAALGRAFDTLA